MAPKKPAKETAVLKRKREAAERDDEEEKKKQQALLKTSLAKSNNPDAKTLLTVYESLDRFSTEKTELLQRWLQEMKSNSIAIVTKLV